MIVRVRLPIRAACIATLLIIASGLAVRRWTPYWFGEHAGNVLWGVMWALLVKVVHPRATPPLVGLIALAITWGIEFFQLTHWPAEWSSQSIFARSLLGGAFELHDLLGNALGVMLATLAIQAIPSTPTEQPPTPVDHL